MAKTVFLFPGQGAQTVGMGRDLLTTHPETKRLFDEAGDVLGFDLLDICLNGPTERLNATDVSQPAIFVASMGALEKLRAEEPTACDDCTATAGLSLGEYTALVFAGAMTFREGLEVVRERGRAMQRAAEANPSGMVSILAMPTEEVETVCEAASEVGLIRVANRLCPGNIVVSGTIPACERIEQLVEEKGGKCKRLAVAGAFHTELMKPADEHLAAALERVEIKPPRVPVWSNVDARPHTDPTEIRQLLVRQVLSPVLWEETMRGLLAEGVERFYEIGPGRVLAGLLKRVERKADMRNVGV